MGKVRIGGGGSGSGAGGGDGGGGGGGGVEGGGVWQDIVCNSFAASAWGITATMCLCRRT